MAFQLVSGTLAVPGGGGGTVFSYTVPPGQMFFVDTIDYSYQCNGAGAPPNTAVIFLAGGGGVYSINPASQRSKQFEFPRPWPWAGGSTFAFACNGCTAADDVTVAVTGHLV